MILKFNIEHFYIKTDITKNSPDGDTYFFDIVAGVLRGDTLARYLFIICQDYILQTSIDFMKENDFTLVKAKSRRCPAQTITDTDNAGDIALLANTPTQAESLQHSLEQAAWGISLHVNANKTEYMCFNQGGDIFTLNGGSLKLVDKFNNHRSFVSFTENDISTRLAKAWTTIGHMDQSD